MSETIDVEIYIETSHTDNIQTVCGVESIKLIWKKIPSELIFQTIKLILIGLYRVGWFEKPQTILYEQKTYYIVERYSHFLTPIKTSNNYNRLWLFLHN